VGGGGVGSDVGPGGEVGASGVRPRVEQAAVNTNRIARIPSGFLGVTTILLFSGGSNPGSAIHSPVSIAPVLLEP